MHLQMAEVFWSHEPCGSHTKDLAEVLHVLRLGSPTFEVKLQVAMSIVSAPGSIILHLILMSSAMDARLAGATEQQHTCFEFCLLVLTAFSDKVWQAWWQAKLGAWAAGASGFFLMENQHVH